VVYFARGLSSGNIKIGVSADPLRRIATIGRQNGEEMELLAVIPGSYHKEHQTHIQFSKFNLYGEWFEPAQEIFDFIDSLPHSNRLCRRPSAKYYDNEKKIVVKLDKETYGRLQDAANDNNRNLANLAGDIIADWFAHLPVPYRLTAEGRALLASIGVGVAEAKEQSNV
jgi:hypothetical protein